MKIFNKESDIQIFPEQKNIYGYFVNEINLIIFVKEYDDFWVPNAKEFGKENYFSEYKNLDLKKENIKEAKQRICNIFNNIKSSQQYIHIETFMSYNYEQIKECKELNNFGNFLISFIG